MHQLIVFILAVATFANVDVRLFTHSDLADDFMYMASLHERSQGQVVEAHVCQSVPAIVFSCVEHALMLEKMLNDLESVGALEVGQRFYQGQGDELVVPHTLLDGREHTEVVIREILDQLGVQLHGFFI